MGTRHLFILDSHRPFLCSVGMDAVVVSAAGLVTVADIAGSKTNKEPKLTGTYPFIVGFLEKNKSDFLEIRAGLKNRQNRITERKQHLDEYYKMSRSY
jgi:hypothetical protein